MLESIGRGVEGNIGISEGLFQGYVGVFGPFRNILVVFPQRTPKVVGMPIRVSHFMIPNFGKLYPLSGLLPGFFGLFFNPSRALARFMIAMLNMFFNPSRSLGSYMLFTSMCFYNTPKRYLVYDHDVNHALQPLRVVSRLHTHRNHN